MSVSSVSTTTDVRFVLFGADVTDSVTMTDLSDVHAFITEYIGMARPYQVVPVPHIQVHSSVMTGKYGKRRMHGTSVTRPMCALPDCDHVASFVEIDHFVCTSHAMAVTSDLAPIRG